MAIAASSFSGCAGNASGSNGSNGGSDTPTTASIVTQPASASVTLGQTATFAVVAAGTAPITYQWRKNGSSISGATSASYTTPATTSGDNHSTFDVIVSNSLGSVTSSSATLTVNAALPGPAATTDVVTYHYDNLRTGQNLNETTLTLANVQQAKFGLLGTFLVDGLVDGQPLFLANLNIPNKGSKNVVYAVTEHGTVYAFDTDAVGGNTSSFLWKTSTLASGESTGDARGCSQVMPEIGITSTPVIDRSRNAIYVVSTSTNSSGAYFQRIHALDLTTGAELFGGPTEVTASFTGSGAGSSNGKVSFDPKQYKERAGLLQVGSNIYTTWASHCDRAPYTSWVIAYSADTLKQTGVLNLVPNGADGGIWMSGAAPAADAAGGIYFIIGNGDFGTSLDGAGMPANKNCGNCFARISAATPLQLLDYFTPQDTVNQSAADLDFGSGGPLLLPDLKDASGNTRHLALGSGKDTNIYVLDRDNMGKFNSGANNVYQVIPGQIGLEFAKPSYFNGTVYYGAIHDTLKAFRVTNAKLSTMPSSQSSRVYGYPGSAPVISANGTSNGIVWTVENSSNGILHAYDAADLSNELYNSGQAANSRDSFSANKYITPTVANGRVFVGTTNSLAVFGLLP